MPTVKRLKALAPPRERILQAARELFYRDGIRAAGVEATAPAAGTNKMPLSRHFASKDELVAEYLKELAGQAETLWEAARAEHPGDADRQLRYLLKRVSQFADVCSGRGCALANAAIELTEPAHPARKVIEDHKREQRQLLAALCRKAGYVKPESVADELCLLVDGARVSLQCFGPEGPGARLFALAEGLLDAAPRKKKLKTA